MLVKNFNYGTRSFRKKELFKFSFYITKFPHAYSSIGHDLMTILVLFYMIVLKLVKYGVKKKKSLQITL